jgi:hypothetical protein
MIQGLQKADRLTAEMEYLEPRRLFSSPPAPAVQNGILKIWGTPGDDTIEVERFTVHQGPAGTDLQPFYAIYLDGITTTVPDTGIDGVHVHAGAGNDIVDLVDSGMITVPTPTNVIYDENPVAIPETVFGGQGDDLIQAGYGNPGPLVTSLPLPASTGPCALHGGPGNDTISGTYGALYAGQGNDSITAGINTTVFAGQGSDSINVGNYLGDPIYNGGGTDIVMGNDTVGQLEPG